ncbi:serine protease [Streptomyces griseoviridis]|uniref:serine protease n=1 Tax=Streptomyces griseoviridis TaxID=45398 RepID=UPI00344F5359
MVGQGRSVQRTGGPGGAGALPSPGDGGSGDGGSLDDVLVDVRDLAGRPRGTGFVADRHGTVVTGHEAVAGLPRFALLATGGRGCLVAADDVTPLPALGLALIRTRGLGVEPLPVTVRDRVEAGTYVRLAAGCWREARLLGPCLADADHHLPYGAMELAIGTAGRDALRAGGGAAGGPVLDARTGAVLGVVATALPYGDRDACFALPLPALPGPLAELLARNAATVPARGPDLNLAGVLELTAASAIRATAGHEGGPSVERAVVAGEFDAFLRGPATVLGLVGPPGSGRTAELAALAARLGRGPAPLPVLRLRGADLRTTDDSIADAVGRVLARTADAPAPDRLADVARSAGRPLLLLLDSPEEMPPGPAHRPDAWASGTAHLLARTGARLVVACRAEYWEGTAFPPGVVHRAAGTAAVARPPSRRSHADLTDGVGLVGRVGLTDGVGMVGHADLTDRVGLVGRVGLTDRVDLTGHGDLMGHGDLVDRVDRVGLAPHPGLPPHVRIGGLGAGEARRLRERLGVPDGALAGVDAGHPGVVRALGEVLAAMPGGAVGRVGRDEVFSAYLDLRCLRVAERLAAENGVRGDAVRRLAVKVAGQVHVAARRGLGPGQGQLDRATFEAVFPRGTAPRRLGGGTGWASAVLAEGLLMPVGAGYRFAHEELADWLHGSHLDLDEALHALVHAPGATAHPLPHHRAGPVVEALLLLARRHGSAQLNVKLLELTGALAADPASWWASRLLSETLRRVPDATPYRCVLRELADVVVRERAAEREQAGHHGPGARGAARDLYGPGFWCDLALPAVERFELLRLLVPADGPPQDTDGGPRFLDAVSQALAADPTTVQPLLIRWFDDERPLPATPHAGVADAAQALLHTHRRRAPDDLTEALVASAHRRADELLAVLAEDEPSAVCRAVDRWAHDEHPARRAAAATHGLRAAPHLRADADRDLLRRAALALLTHPADDPAPHGGALALLARDPRTRARHLPDALRQFAAGDPTVAPTALLAALTTHPEPVLDAFRQRLSRPDAGEALRALADVTLPPLADRVAALVREAVRRRPETAPDIAALVARRLDQDPAARAVLLPLTTALLDDGPEEARAALAAVLAAPGTPASRPLRRELLARLLAHERAPAVLATLLHTAAGHGGDDARDLLHRTALLLARTPDGAARLDHALVDLARRVPGFAARMAGWLTGTPHDWADVVTPGTRRMIDNLSEGRVSA